MKMSRISGCFSKSPGKCVHSAGAFTEKFLRSRSLKRDVFLEFLERQLQASNLTFKSPARTQGVLYLIVYLNTTHARES